MKKLRRILTFGILTFIFCSFICCNSPKPKSRTQATPKIIRLKIINKTILNYKRKDTTVIDSNTIALFNAQLKLMKEAENLNLRYSYGYYEIRVFYDDGAVNIFNVFLTVYDGVVIDDSKNDKTYKNNKIEELVMGILRN